MSRPIVVTGRHRPHELLLLVVSIITGLAYLLGSPPPGSVAALMPDWLISLWAVGLLISGAMGLFGAVYRRDLELGLIAEGAAMLIGAGALLVAAYASFEYAGWHALLGGGITGAWMGANLWRAMQIRADLKELRP